MSLRDTDQNTITFIADDEGTHIRLDAMQAFWQASHDDWTLVQLVTGERMTLKMPIEEIRACIAGLRASE